MPGSASPKQTHRSLLWGHGLNLYLSFRRHGRGSERCSDSLFICHHLQRHHISRSAYKSAQISHDAAGGNMLQMQKRRVGLETSRRCSFYAPGTVLDFAAFNCKRVMFRDPAALGSLRRVVSSGTEIKQSRANHWCSRSPFAALRIELLHNSLFIFQLTSPERQC